MHRTSDAPAAIIRTTLLSLALLAVGSVIAQNVTLRLFYHGWNSTEQELA
jgi:hypothetical protein